MFGKILYISDSMAYVQNLAGSNVQADLMNMHVIFESNGERILGEITEVNSSEIKIRFLGEYQGNRFLNGVLRKPLLSSTIRIINGEELMALVGTYSENSFVLGQSAIYKNFTVCPSINDLFSNHLAIFGNTGSGKSCGVSRMVQNIFLNKFAKVKNANMFIFDAYGEYKNAFSSINTIDPEYNYKFITTNPKEATDVPLKIPVNLLKLDDYALLLQASKHTQLPILERTLKLSKIFATDSPESRKYKNHLIAKALLAVLFSSETTAQKKNEIFTIIETCHTPEFNFDTTIQGLGYTRSFSECFEIDSNGYFGESVLITEYILKNINDEIENIAPDENAFYSLLDFSKALEFTLISEGFLHNDTLVDDASILKVRLTTILHSEVGNYFDGTKHYTNTEFIDALKSFNGKKAQIININLEDVDDIYAKVIVKIMCKFLFDYSKSLEQRASIPFHLFLEEAHRYIQKDNDTFLLGYNIFDRIAKEGRKYGVTLLLSSQRPSEISETIFSQCNNFIAMRLTNPNDQNYVKKLLPDVMGGMIDKIQSLQAGEALIIGDSIVVPSLVKIEECINKPSSVDIPYFDLWKEKWKNIDFKKLEKEWHK
mgnify:CR=1 FL=1